MGGPRVLHHCVDATAVLDHHLIHLLTLAKHLEQLKVIDADLTALQARQGIRGHAAAGTTRGSACGVAGAGAAGCRATRCGCGGRPATDARACRRAAASCAAHAARGRACAAPDVLVDIQETIELAGPRLQGQQLLQVHLEDAAPLLHCNHQQQQDTNDEVRGGGCVGGTPRLRCSHAASDGHAPVAVAKELNHFFCGNLKSLSSS